MRVAALIVGIDGWERYTLPLVESLKLHEPGCQIVVIDNASETPYPALDYVHRTERLCYSAAINRAAEIVGAADWYVILSNDVICEGPFIRYLAGEGGDGIVGPCLKEVHGFPYLEGWCVCVPSMIWQVLGGWDDKFRVSSWEDVDFSTRALETGFNLSYGDIFFRHLDQRQRFGLVPDYWDSEKHNIEYFMQRHQRAAVL